MSCYHIVEQWAAWPEHRVEAQVESAVVAAESAEAPTFDTRRGELLETVDRSDRSLTGLVDLGLGRGSLLLDRVDDAREHLRAAIAAARDTGSEDLLGRAEELLRALEDRAEPEMEAATPSDASRRIAEQVASLGLAPVS